MNIQPAQGDIVDIKTFVYDRWYQDQGPITTMTWDHVFQTYNITVNDHVYRLDGSIVRLVPPADATCRLCGESGVELMTPVRITQNYGEDGEEDDGGCFSESRTEWRCADQNTCRQNRREWAAIMRSAAIAEDGAMREAGFGVIGAARVR